MNSSGPISLGGSTTGQSINLEIGANANATVSLNSTIVRLLANVTSNNSTITMPTNFYGKTYSSLTVTYLLVGAGGGGGFGMGGGGGGGGVLNGIIGYNKVCNIVVTLGYPGLGGNNPCVICEAGYNGGGKGGNTSLQISSQVNLVAIGGGGGSGSLGANGSSGGSGGGGGGGTGGGQSAGKGGSGTACQGFAGGNAFIPEPNTYDIFASGGGGGAGGSGNNGTANSAGAGGAGKYVNIANSNIAYGAGGGGAVYCANLSPFNMSVAVGGSGTGGNGGNMTINATSGQGVTFTGGGGGGNPSRSCGPSTGPRGAFGIAIIEYTANTSQFSIVGNNYITTATGSYCSSGTRRQFIKITLTNAPIGTTGSSILVYTGPR